MRLVIARCAVDYKGRLNTYLPEATRLIMIKADGSILIHSEGGSYKPLNWMQAPLSFHQTVIEPGPAVLGELKLPEGTKEVWRAQRTKSDDRLMIYIFEKQSDDSFDLGTEPGLIKDGVEADLQSLLADQIGILGSGHTLIQREYATAIGPVDILARDPDGKTVAVELKRRGEIDGVEQLSRYLELLNRDPLLAPVTGVFAAQYIKPQAKVLAVDRGIRCITLDYSSMRGIEDGTQRRLF